MKVITSIAEMASFSKKIKQRGQKISFVPTMGALHEGHLALISAAKAKGDVVVVSIFVNPIQFGPKEDLSRYPRDLKADKEKLSHFDPIIIFNPKAEEMYPKGFNTTIDVPGLGDKLCGKFRPGHFKGVATVVAKLFNIVMPNHAFFGEKDFQQQVIIKKMVKDLNYDIEVISVPTVREYDGLAMSSRNAYLSPEERRSAGILYRALCHGKKLIVSGIKDPKKIISALEKMISSVPGMKIEYVSIVDPETLEDLKTLKGRILIALAVWLNKTRLIDNERI